MTSENKGGTAGQHDSSLFWGRVFYWNKWGYQPSQKHAED
jgi:hypothetical protein